MPSINRSRQYVARIIDQHQQISLQSCIPSAVEMVLKLLGKVDSDYYDQQSNWTNGSFEDFDGQTISEVTFRRINLAERGPDFPHDQLFNIIDQELESDRYVVISLLGRFREVSVYHAYIIFDKTENNGYLAVTKAFTNRGQVTQFIDDVKNRVRQIQGTDILTYTLSTQ
jgi:hypothetical protein